ncbi:MAG: AAA family ATPase [Solirubrobacteraceae bacterium]|nr:AAA family ATPase [Solirubrobacteraceae bacterium]
MRRCADCGNRATTRARFCEQCGAALTPNAKPLRAPRTLEAKILRQRAGIEGERKQVTVMYTDIVGSMELTRALDAERYGVVLDRFLAIAADAVHEFEGTVNQFTGDGLLAVFGAPLAHEDHARRACLAVLRLQREVAQLAAETARRDGVRFAVRCGCNSGEVIVGAIGDDVHMDFVPIGSTTALGKRIESLAPAGSTAISASTAALVEGEFELRELGRFEVKGEPTPQRVLELVGPGTAQTRLAAVAATRGLSVFVGRDAESAELLAALERAVAGDGRAIGIVGDAGVGKSRLVHEFVAGCAARGLVVNATGGVAHGRYVPFLPILALYRAYFGIGERDVPEIARERIERTLRALDPALTADVPLLCEFLGVAGADRPPVLPDPVARRRRLLTALTRIFTTRSRREPAVLVVEDLHWIDDASDAFLEELAEAVVGTRTLLICTYRPDYDAAWTSHEAHAQLSLGPLPVDASDDLLTGLLGCDRSLDGLPTLIEARTRGNPFFIEEIVQALVEGGHLTGARGQYRLVAELDGLVLPATVQAALSARIDRLPARAKALVQTMSVIGSEVPAPILSEVADLGEGQLAEAVEILAAAQWVILAGAGDSREYAFKHPLTQEVAYRSQLSGQRARTHEAVAAAIERTYPDGLDQRAALLAHHCEAAGDMLQAAAWHARAAAWAEVASPADSMRHWRRVRHLASALEPSPERDELATKAAAGILSLAWRLGISPEESAALHAEGSDAERLRLDLFYAGSLMHSGREREGLEGFRAAHRQAVADCEPGRALTASTGVAYANWIAGSLSEASETIDRALALAGGDPTTGSGIAFRCPLAHSIGDRGRSIGYMGRLDEARRAFDLAIELAREHGDPETESAAHANLAHLEVDAGDVEAALRNAALGLAIAEPAANAIHIIACTSPAAAAQVRAGHHADGLARAAANLATIRELGIGLYFEPLLLATIAHAQLALGKPGEALAAAEQAVEIMDARGLKTCALRAPITLAQVLLATQGDAAGDRVDAVLARALAVARESHARVFEPPIHRELAALARLRGDDVTAARQQAAAERMVAAMRSATAYGDALSG